MLIMIGTSSKGLSRSLYLLACIKRVIVLNSSRLFCRLQCLFHLNYTALPSKAVLSL